MEQTTLFEYVLNNGGATLGTDFKPIEKKRGYCVSLAGFETRLSLSNPSAKMLFEYYLIVYAERARKAGAFVGLWIDKGILYFDLSRVFSDKKKALKEGAINAQKAIYDLAKGESIYLA